MTGVDEASRGWRMDAGVYDAWFDRPWGSYASGVEYALLTAGLHVRGRRVCDAGCGTGRFTARLERSGAAVVGVDRDAAALALAQRRVEGPLVRGDVDALPFPDGCFDVTVAAVLCEFTADPGRTIAELVRVTGLGGRVLVGSLNPHSPWGLWHRHRLHRPPWSAARFLTRAELERLGRRHGRTRWRAGLMLPRSLPAMRHWAPATDRIGARVAGRWGAFGVLTITLPARDD